MRHAQEDEVYQLIRQVRLGCDIVVDALESLCALGRDL